MSAIIDSDIFYRDQDVTILNPMVKKGIIIGSRYTRKNKNLPPICKVGLKSGEQLYNEGIDFGRIVFHPYIFFRAPIYANNIDYSSIETEIHSLYGDYWRPNDDIVFIRVDPDNTNVYSSELRVNFGIQSHKIYESKHTLTDYLNIIKNNDLYIKQNQKFSNIIYNLITLQPNFIPYNKYDNDYHGTIYSDTPIERNSEILVHMHVLPPSYFVLCQHSHEDRHIEVPFSIEEVD